ncbi:hypothetical protein G6F56_010543 [Rhizopus delemar]|nr:hypothetical protein G6F56_010543 [Rhizopus delemar]
MSKVNYVCQRAAHTILSETSTRYISTDGLQAINAFIDEFLSIIISTIHSCDLHCLKSAVQHHLPNTLGKNALLEADIELKGLLDISFDFSDYETKRQNMPNMTEIQRACADHCTLSDHKSQTSDVMIIYLTAIVEHIAEYLLISLSDQTDTDLLRAKEILVGLVSDTKVNHLFQKMKLKEQLQKKISTYLNTPTLPLYNEPKSDSSLSINSSRKSMESDSSSKSSKRRFSFFGNKNRNSMHISFPQPRTSPLPSPHPSPLATDFEDLFLSGQTKKVSLTPNRLRSIEITPQTAPIYHTSPPPTPAASLSSRPSQRSRQSVILEEDESFERPSESALKRHSIRPHSFYNTTECVSSQEVVYTIPQLRLKAKSKASQTDSTIKQKAKDDWNEDKERHFAQWLLSSH